MKIQYFGDTRDLFMDDIVVVLVEGVPGLRHFPFVPLPGRSTLSADLSTVFGRVSGYGD